MSTSAAARAVRATEVRVGRSYIEVALNDGRTVKVPISWFPRLAGANQRDRRGWRLIGGGIGIRWDELDEDVSVENLLAGSRI